MVLLLLITAAAACLATGLITTNVVFTYVALGLAIAGAALIIGNIVLRQRNASESLADTPGNETDNPDEGKAIETDDPSDTSPVEPDQVEGAENSELTSAHPARETPRPPEHLVTTAGATSTTAEPNSDGSHQIPETAEDGLVFVIPGRKRFHRDTCHFLRRDPEELTLEEARDEGFTACTACAPDLSVATTPSVFADRT